MPTKQRIIVTKSKDPKRLRIGISFEFDADDPRAAEIYRGFALFLQAALTPEEQGVFLAKFASVRAKLRA